METMIKVKLIASTDANILELASHAAQKCYQAEDPVWGKKIDVEERLFKVSHHTTLQHTFFTFDIEGIAIGDITFGLHLNHPFYNSDQRSGRYCAKMFLEPNFLKIENYIKNFWPKVRKLEFKNIMAYIEKGVEIYHANFQKALEISTENLKKERPYISEVNLLQNAPKIAQEQLRMFIPAIFPTGLDFTINTTVLSALHRVAWTPSMRFVVSEMVRAVTEKFPEANFMFSEESKAESRDDWAISIPKRESIKVKFKPVNKLLAISGEKDFVMPKSEILHPVDLSHFDPRMMKNSTSGIKSQLEISTATMGQDQRHRTIRRGEPKFTGAFYLPPILRQMRMNDFAKEYVCDWINISKNIPKTLAMILAPYGAMVKYNKEGSFNAIAHEQGKRLCFCAQEEIYHAGLTIRKQIERRNAKSKVLKIFEPPCYRTGKCVEGARFCGRDLATRKTGNYFPERKV